MWDIRYRDRSRARRAARGGAGATLTRHVGCCQVLPRHRVDAERWRMCGRVCPSFLPSFRTPQPLLARPAALLSARIRVCGVLLVSLRFCIGGYTPVWYHSNARHLCTTTTTIAHHHHCHCNHSMSTTTSRRRISSWHRHYTANLP